MSEAARVKCKGCEVWMPRLDWMTKKECENPNCTCPLVKEAMRKTQQVIEQAQNGGRTINLIDTQTAFVPSDKNPREDQYFIDVPKVMTITVTPPRIKGAISVHRGRGK